MWPHVSANQNGETALDVARRMKIIQCEEAVSNFWVRSYSPSCENC